MPLQPITLVYSTFSCQFCWHDSDYDDPLCVYVSIVTLFHIALYFYDAWHICMSTFLIPLSDEQCDYESVTSIPFTILHSTFYTFQVPTLLPPIFSCSFEFLTKIFKFLSHFSPKSLIISFLMQNAFFFLF